MTIVTVQLVLTLSSPDHRPTQIHKTFAISLGRNLDGSAMTPSILYPGINNVGVLEVDLELPSIASFESQSPQLHVLTAHVAPDGTLKTSQTDARLQPKSEVYKTLELLQVEYTSENLTCAACGGLLEPVQLGEPEHDLGALCHECRAVPYLPF